MIHLRENVVKNTKKYVKNFPAPRIAEAKENATDFRGWHRNEMQYLAKQIEKEYSFDAVGMTSWVGSTLTAYLSPATAQALARDARVMEIEEIDATQRATPSGLWNDRFEGGERIPWGKQSIGTDDALSSTIPIYLFDRTPHAHPDLTFNIAPVNSPGNYIDRDHATFIMGILGAKSNGQFVRGINPGATNLWSVEIGDFTAPSLLNSIDFTLAHSEQNSTYGVISISINDLNSFRFDQPKGKLIRRGSTRSFIAQSAGNNSGSACERAYCSPQLHGYYGTPTQNKVDGIVVVGGIDADNKQELSYDNANLVIGFTGSNASVTVASPGQNPFFASAPGSNAGHCVEMWAPSTTFSTLTWFPSGPTSATPISFQAKGTSFAAPPLAAQAARYGGPSTTPVQRESYLRSILQHTGNQDTLFEPIYKPNSTAIPITVVASRLMPTSIQASSSTASSDLWSTQDSLYLSGNYWNAGSARGWIQFDLGQTRTLTSIRMVPEQSGFGNSKHQIFVGDGQGLTQIGSVSEYAEILSPISLQLNNASGRYVRVVSDLFGLSWVSWREVEIYGN